MGRKCLKKKKSVKDEVKEEEDRISFLQDDLLCRILSLLPIKDAVATSALSTRWEKLYASITDLYFLDAAAGAQTASTTSNFIAFVTNVISAVLTKSQHIRKLEVSCHYGPYPSSLLVSWIDKVLGPNLQELSVRTSSPIDPVSLPPQLLHCRALTSLTLKGAFSLCVPEDVLFPSLKELSMSLMILPDEGSLKRIFEGCVVLESLSLWKCVMDSITFLKVSIISLKKLLLNISGDYELLLNTPNLDSFNFTGYARRGYSGEILNSLDDAFLLIEVEEGNFAYDTSKLMRMVFNARSLWLERYSMEFLFNQTTIFHRLTTLRLDPASAEGWLSLPNLLKNAPCLEVIDFIHGVRCDFEGDFVDLLSYFPEQVPVCVSAHLKEVIFSMFVGEEIEYKMVEYFLKNAEMLEILSISPAAPWDSEDRELSSEDQLLMARNLLGIPRVSKACLIDFGYPFA